MTPLAGHDEHAIDVLWLVVCLIGSMAIVSLFAIYRRAASRHALEEADRVIAEHGRDDD